MAESPSLLSVLRGLTERQASNAGTDISLTNAAMFSQIQSLVECPICFEPCAESKILACGHTFCRQCLLAVADIDGCTTTVSCPLDRINFTLPRGGVDGLPTNFVLSALVGLKPPADAEGDGSSGGEHLCEDCKAHQGVLTCGHCSRRLCGSCCRMHTDQGRVRLRQCSAQLQHACKAFKTTLACRRTVTEVNNDSLNSVKDSLSEFADSLLQTITNVIFDQKKQILAHVEDLAKTYISHDGVNDQAQQDELLQTAKDCMELIDKLLNSTTMFELSNEKLSAIEKESSNLKSRMKEVAQSTFVTKTIHFKPNLPSSERQENLCKKLAKYLTVELVVEDADIDATFEEEPDGAVDIPPADHDWYEKQMKEQAMHVQEAASAASAPLPRPDSGTMLDALAQIQESPPPYDPSWQQLGGGERRRNHGHLIDPRGIALVATSHNICVADAGDNYVRVFSPEGSYLGSFGGSGSSLGKFGCPWGMACSRSGQLVIVDSGNHRVQLVEASGRAVLAWGQRGATHGAFKYPQGVAVDISTDFIYVCDSGNHRIQVFNSGGAFIKQIGSAGRRYGEFSLPRDVAVAGGNVAVADSNNNRIQVFNTEGGLLRMIPVQSPCGIALRRDGNELYACCKTHIVVYTLFPVFSLKKTIDSPVPGKRAWWITLLTSTQALVTVTDEHKLSRISLV